MVKQNGKSSSSKKAGGGGGGNSSAGMSMLNAKGPSKSNPWSEDQILAGMDANLQHSSAQAVQSLPGVLADDEILAAILKPHLNGPIQLGQLENVTPLKVSYGGTSTEQPSGGGGNLVKQKVHKNQQVEYDRSKGFVSTSWANFLMDPDKAKESPLTTQKEGLFIRHVTSTVLNPSGKAGKGGGGGGAPPSVNIDSVSYTSGSLMSNTWTNVLMYTPKEQVFKMDAATGKYKPAEGGSTQKKKPASARPAAAASSTSASSTSASSTSTSTSMKNEPSKSMKVGSSARPSSARSAKKEPSTSVTSGFSRSTSAASIKKQPSKSVKLGSSARPSSARSVKKEPSKSVKVAPSASSASTSAGKKENSKSVKVGASASSASTSAGKKEPSKSVKVGPAASSASTSAGKKENSKSVKKGAKPKSVAKKK